MEPGARIAAMDAVCERCGGTGWILDSADGRKSARPCGCRLERTIRERLELSGIPQRFEDRTLDTFLTNNAELTRALERAREFVDRYPFVEGGLLFVGPSGRGKTHLACAILSDLIRNPQGKSYQKVLKYGSDAICTSMIGNNQRPPYK